MLGPCVTSAAAEGPETWFQRCLKCYPVIHTPCFSSHLLTSLMFSSKSCGTCWLLHMVVSVQIKLYLVLEQLGLAIILFSSGRCLLQCSPGSTCYGSAVYAFAESVTNFNKSIDAVAWGCYGNCKGAAGSVGQGLAAEVCGCYGNTQPLTSLGKMIYGVLAPLS